MERKKEESNTSQILKKLKNNVQAFVFDVDGTIKSSAEPDCLPTELIKIILENKKFVGIVTASGVSVFEGLMKQIEEMINRKTYKIPIYFGIANGTALYQLGQNNRKELYNFSIPIEETEKILAAWQFVMRKNKLKIVDLMEKGLVTFTEFIYKDWGEYISKEYVNLVKQYNGQCFVEKLKATFVMPREDLFSQSRFVTLLQKEIDKATGGNKYIIDMGDNIFAHLTYRPAMNPKLFALKRIISELKLKEDQVAIFGDMPLGNDKGLLVDSGLPYTFTNKYLAKNDTDKPPFILPRSEKSPVASVYRAVYLLLS